MITFRVSKSEDELIKRYAASKRLTVSDVARIAILEKIEDEYDYECAAKALEEYRKKPVGYTHEDAKKELGIE